MLTKLCLLVRSSFILFITFLILIALTFLIVIDSRVFIAFVALLHSVNVFLCKSIQTHICVSLQHVYLLMKAPSLELHLSKDTQCTWIGFAGEATSSNACRRSTSVQRPALSSSSAALRSRWLHWLWRIFFSFDTMLLKLSNINRLVPKTNALWAVRRDSLRTSCGGYNTQKTRHQRVHSRERPANSFCWLETVSYKSNHAHRHANTSTDKHASTGYKKKNARFRHTDAKVRAGSNFCRSEYTVQLHGYIAPESSRDHRVCRRGTTSGRRFAHVTFSMFRPAAMLEFVCFHCADCLPCPALPCPSVAFLMHGFRLLRDRGVIER